MMHVQPFRTIARITVALALAALVVLPVAALAQYTYQIDSGPSRTPIHFVFNNSLGTETTANIAEDNWVANTFTAVTGAVSLRSITYFTGAVGQRNESPVPPFLNILDFNASTMPSAFVTAALYKGSPATGLTLVPGSMNTVPLSAPSFSWLTIPFASPQTVVPGQTFTAALLINNVPWNAAIGGLQVLPFSMDTSGVSVDSYYDVSNPVGSVNNYILASPNHPTLNGAPYPGQTGTNYSPGVTILRVNAMGPPNTTSGTNGTWSYQLSKNPDGSYSLDGSYLYRRIGHNQDPLYNASISSATLGGAAAPGLPGFVQTIYPGETKYFTLTFPALAGDSGSLVPLFLGITYESSDGLVQSTYNTRLNARLP